MTAATILIADDDRAIRTVLTQALGRLGHEVRTTGNAATLWRWVADGQGDLVITDVVMPDENGLDLIPRIKKLRPELRVIVMSAQNTLITALKAAERGAFEYLPKPFDLKELVSVVERALNSNTHAAPMVNDPNDGEEQLPLIGRSPAMQEIYRVLARLMGTDLTVMITGESGTGKELVARALHQLSGRMGAFVPLNCASIAPELLESELFGHVQGAFTGARKGRDGLFRVAHQGTLFLDEIGEMPLAMQSSLLRALEQKAIRPVGAERELSVDVRIVAATNRNLKAEVEAGRFREDLFYRLNVVALPVAPLRDRVDDIPALVHHFTRQLTAEMGMGSLSWTHEDVVAMQAYPWPGNVRELRNLIERCLLLGKPPADYWQSAQSSEQSKGGEGYPLEWALSEVEKAHILQVVERFEGNKSAASRVLGVARKTLERKFKEWAIE